MNHSPNTQTTTALLNGLCDPRDESAWKELTDRCCPIMRVVAERLGVAPSDVDDVVQATLVSFIDAWRRGQYDRTRGRLCAFLVMILRSRILDLQRRLAHHGTCRGDSALIELPPTDEVERFWMDERHHRLLAVALDQLRTEGVDRESLDAFELYALRGNGADEVAASLSISRERVYEAKYRVSRRIQPILTRLDELYEDV